MKTYIERAAVETMLENAQIITDGENCGYCTEDVNLGSIPAADVAEVKHGRWIDGVCSECGFDAMYYKGIPAQVYTDYCPSCGARMGEEDEHDKHPSDPV